MTANMIRGALGLVVAALTASAQVASLTPNSTALNPAGGVVVFDVTLAFSGPAVCRWDAALPPGWSYVSGANEPTVKPDAGARGAISWSSLTALSSPVNFSFTAAYPSGSPRASVGFSALLSQSSGATRITLEAVAFGPPGAPLITRQPRSITVGSTAATAVVRVSATGVEPLAYQWRKNGIAIPGANQSSYGPANAAPPDSGNYDVIVSNAFGSVASNVAVLTVLDVNPGAAPPVIYAHPSDSSGTVGGAASFSALAFTNTTLSYQWLRNGAPIAGATGATLVLPNLQPADAAAYAVIISNVYGAATSRPASLTVNSAAASGDAPTIIEPPANQIVPSGTRVRLSVLASGTPPLSYQWLCYGVPVVGGNAATLELPSPSAGGNYRVVVMNALGAVTSRVATVAVVPDAIGPLQLGSLPTVKTIAGGSAVFTADDRGSPPMSYQWYKGNVALPAQTASTLAFSNVIPSDAGQYLVMYSNAFGSGRAGGNLVVLPEPVAPSFLFQPSIGGSLGAIDSSTTLFANVDGTGPFAFQWLKNGREIPGATLVPLVIPIVKGGDAGSYTLRASNTEGSVTSSATTLTVHSADFATIGVGPAGLPAIVAQPISTTVRQRAQAILSVSVVADVTPVSYQWRKDGVAITGASRASFALTEATVADAGDYSVVVWNARGLAVSEAAHLSVSGRGFAGTYFGTIIGSDAPSRRSPAVVRVDDNNTAVCFGSYVYGRTFVIDEAGRFLINQPATSGSIAGANAAFSFEGVFTDDGRVTGSYYHPLSGTRATLSASRTPSTGPTQAFVGSYAVGVQNSPASGSVIIDANGHAFAAVSTVERADFGTGTVDADGRISIAGAIDTQITGTVRADGSVVLNVTSLGTSPPLTFRGGREGRAEPERVVNISTRAAAGAVGTNPLIAGFVLAGTEPKTVLVRAIGPALAQFSVTNPLSAVRLELFQGAKAIASNSGWDTGDGSTTSAIAATMDRVGAFVLPSGSKNAVLLTTLEPGSYTAQVTGVDGATGVALVEVYDATGAATPAERRLINISSRAQVGSGENALVAGFVVSGTQPKRVLIRGVGPGLTQFGVPGTLIDPLLQLFDQRGAIVATNDDWSSGTNLDLFFLISAAQGAAGAFALPVQSKDAVLLLSLAPGSYTAQVTGVGSVSGVALVEVYEVP